MDEDWMDPDTFLPEDHGGSSNPDVDRWPGMIRIAIVDADGTTRTNY